MIRLAELTPHLGGGGIEIRIARVLAGLSPREFERCWVGFTPAEPKITAIAGPDVRILTFEKKPSLVGVDLRLIETLRRFFRRERPDVVHVHNFASSVYGILGARLAGVRSVIYESAGRERVEGPSARQIAVLRALAPHIDVVVGVCDFLAAEARDSFGLSGDRVRVLPTGIDLERFNPGEREHARERLHIPAGAFVVGTIGMFRPVKRVEDVLEAGLRLLAAAPDAYLIIGGADRFDQVPESYWAAARAAGVADRVRLPGRVYGTDKVVPAFDVFVNASTFEGASNAIIEAFAVGAAVIATRVGGNPDVVEDGRTGALVPPEAPGAIFEAMQRYHQDRGLLAQTGQAALETAQQRHSIQGMVDAYAALFRELAARPARSPVQGASDAVTGLLGGMRTWAERARR